MQKLLLITLLSPLLLANNIVETLQEHGITIPKGDENLTIKRHKDTQCEMENMTPKRLFGGNFSSKKVPKVCQKRLVTHIGELQPLQLHPEVKTLGEIELLTYLKTVTQHPEDAILIDARPPSWYHAKTIPTARNLPFNKIHYEKDIYEDSFQTETEFLAYKHAYQRLFRLLNIEKNEKGLSFEHAKNVVLFSNGSWCNQAPKAIEALLALGYPPQKLQWYRGGLQDWLIYGFEVTTTPSHKKEHPTPKVPKEKP